MNALYLILDLGSLSIPLLFTFHKKIAFYKKWKAFFPALIITSIVFIIWDIAFTELGVWGFNERYLIGINIFNLPLEEVLFFFCIPYASVFTYYTLTDFIKIKTINKWIFYSIGFACLLIALFNYDKYYTFYNFMLAALILVLTQLKKPQIIASFSFSFLIILIPFFIVNGILTGSFIEQEVVWYNNNENLNIRIGTIPVEDFFYAFSLILSNILLTEIFLKKVQKVSYETHNA